MGFVVLHMEKAQWQRQRNDAHIERFIIPKNADPTCTILKPQSHRIPRRGERPTDGTRLVLAIDRKPIVEWFKEHPTSYGRAYTDPYSRKGKGRGMKI